MEQDGVLITRQREQLRRAFIAAAELLNWDAIDSAPVEVASRDVAKLTQTGLREISRELAEEVAAKKSEMSQVKKVARSIQKLAKDDKFTEPVEVIYFHTARAADGFVTRTVTLALADAGDKPYR